MEEVELEAQYQLKTGKYFIEDMSSFLAQKGHIPQTNYRFLSSQNSQFEQLMQVADISQQKSNKFV